MNNRSVLSLVMVLSLALVFCVALPVQAADNTVTFKAVEKDGAKMWEGGGTVDGKRPVTIKVINTLNADHGFSIDTMGVKDVIKPGEEKTITVSPAQIDKSVQEHRVYCQLHPKHGAATLTVK
jgi:hypothetical protein